MANSSSARKRARQNTTRRDRNHGQRSMLRTSIKKVVNLIEAGNHAEAKTALTEATPIIDRMAGKGLIHKNKAARHKARLHKRVRALEEAK